MQQYIHFAQKKKLLVSMLQPSSVNTALPLKHISEAVTDTKLEADREQTKQTKAVLFFMDNVHTYSRAQRYYAQDCHRWRSWKMLHQR